ncbi:type II toxin-antitoxin system RelE/ParE family toxin [Streptomyces sp. NPDC056323]|uniref:type II toxin-antitoxin system RelE family toxin n=1 Tax=Streptomyces sp. NPDC056323 TaxID=3345784 RepID=UPI0035E16CAC
MRRLGKLTAPPPPRKRQEAQEATEGTAPGAPSRNQPPDRQRVVHTIDDGEPVVWAVHVGHRSTVCDT